MKCDLPTEQTTYKAYPYDFILENFNDIISLQLQLESFKKPSPKSQSIHQNNRRQEMSSKIQSRGDTNFGSIIYKVPFILR